MDEEFADYRESAVTYAAIDIGSNAVRLLIKQLESPEAPHFTKVLLLRVPLRLGFDVFSTGSISEKKEKNMVRLMKAYRNLMRIYDVSDYRACATSAMRDAANGPEIIRAIEKKTGIRIEIIDGQEEARMIYNNHIEYMKGRKGNFMYVDVGGGSTEINLLSDGELVCSRSYNIGTVRILNEAVKESEWQRLGKDMKDLVLSYPGINLIGSGGNINKLIKLVRGKDSRYYEDDGPVAARALRQAEGDDRGAAHGGIRHEAGPCGRDSACSQDFPDNSGHNRSQLHLCACHRTCGRDNRRAVCQKYKERVIRLYTSFFVYTLRLLCILFSNALHKVCTLRLVSSSGLLSAYLNPNSIRDGIRS